MSRLSTDSLIDEVVVFLRNNITDLADPQRTNTKTEYFDGDTTTTEFTLQNSTTVKNIKTVTVDGTTMSFGTDWTVVYGTSTVITFTSAPGNGTDNIVITYSDVMPWIYPDYPRNDLTQKSYPRIAVDYTDITTEPHGLNADGDMSSIMLSITIYAEKPHQLRTLIDDVRDNFASNKKSFYNFNYVYPAAVSAIVPSEDRDQQILQTTVDFRIPFAQETNN